jgi:hypothetical protein
MAKTNLGRWVTLLRALGPCLATIACGNSAPTSSASGNSAGANATAGTSAGGNTSGAGGSTTASGGGGESGSIGGPSGGSGAQQAGAGNEGNSGGSAGSSGTTSAAGNAGSGGTPEPQSVCNSTGQVLARPATMKHVLVFLLENEDFGQVNGNAAAPYVSSLAVACGYATQYLDNCFSHNLVSLPHYLALTSGSNCDTGNDQSGTGCITDDKDATSHMLHTQSIFQQVTSWRAYEEGMPSSCDQSSGGSNYACKHNPAAYYAGLGSCTSNDIGIAPITCNPTLKMTACTAPMNAFTDDIAKDSLPAFAFVTPNLQNDMHDGTITQGDNWLYTYLPLVLRSQAYLRGEVAILVLWDEQSTANFGGSTPNLFISPYIAAGSISTVQMNHFSMLRALENALGATTYLGCASGTQPGGGACPVGSTADVRAALNF